jgi:hypothetical protein
MRHRLLAVAKIDPGFAEGIGKPNDRAAQLRLQRLSRSLDLTHRRDVIEV